MKNLKTIFNFFQIGKRSANEGKIHYLFRKVFGTILSLIWWISITGACLWVIKTILKILSVPLKLIRINIDLYSFIEPVCQPIINITFISLGLGFLGYMFYIFIFAGVEFFNEKVIKPSRIENKISNTLFFWNLFFTIIKICGIILGISLIFLICCLVVYLGYLVISGAFIGIHSAVKELLSLVGLEKSFDKVIKGFMLFLFALPIILFLFSCIFFLLSPIVKIIAKRNRKKTLSKETGMN